MKRMILGSMFGAALALAVGCAGPMGPDTGEIGQRVVNLQPDEVPSSLVQCGVRYGDRDQWPQPDAIYGVKGQPRTTVLVLDGELLCRTRDDRIVDRTGAFRHYKSLAVTANEEDGDYDNGDYDNGGDNSDDRIGDSNPLPATPVGGDSAADTRGEADDSNPLPAKNGTAQQDAPSRADPGSSSHQNTVRVSDEQLKSLGDLL